MRARHNGCRGSCTVVQCGGHQGAHLFAWVFEELRNKPKQLAILRDWFDAIGTDDIPVTANSSDTACGL
jgi:hypothetical protein